jgi:hypothetical protein
MANTAFTNLSSALAGALVRPAYEEGICLAAQDLMTAQHYRTQRLRRHNRHLHGWGVVCGLFVVPASVPSKPWAVQICPGYAIGPYGDEIVVPCAAQVDIYNFLWTRPLIPALARTAYIAIRYMEHYARLAPTNPPVCGCNDSIYKPSRIQDGYSVDVLWMPPDVAHEPSVDLCSPGPMPCPQCPDSPYVYLACVNLPASEGDPITYSNIDNWICRQHL